MSTTTVKDIAHKLGVSTASVSVALNGKAGVSPATRQRILDAAAEMGYIAHKSSAYANKTLCFLIYIDQGIGIAQASTFYAFVLEGIEATAKELGYHVLIRYFYAHQGLTYQMSDLLNNVAGLIILGTDMTPHHKTELHALMGDPAFSLPMVIIDNFIFSGHYDCVGNDNLYGAKAAISYLISKGHRSLGYLRSKQRITNFDDRETGVHLALAEYASQVSRPLEIIHVDISADRAYQDIVHWLKSAKKLPDALFAENDVIAASAIRAFKALGIRVPEDISIMGFDDIPICEIVEPAITTVHSFKDQLGGEAVRLLHRRIQQWDTEQFSNDSSTLNLSMSMQIVERGSVAVHRN